MMKRMIAAVVAAAMVMSMNMTVFAVSSTTSDNSGNADSTASTTVKTMEPSAVTDTAVSVEEAAPGAAVNTNTVQVAVVRADGTVAAVTLTEQVAAARESVVTLIASQTMVGSNAGLAVSQLMTTPATPRFSAAVNALGSNVSINDCGTVKTLVSARDAFGNTIASAGKIKGVTSGSLVMLMSVNVDGTVEFVEGIVDSVTGQVLGVFQGAPVTISVMVLVPAM